MPKAIIDKINLTGEIRLSAAHSMVLGHLPPQIGLDELSKKLADKPTAEVMSFGLFDNATPNYNTYYADVTAEDLDPKEEEFINPVYRLLSETIVSKGAPIDFGKPGVLKKSMQKLLGQTINIDHEVAVGNAIGAVSKVFWQESYKDAKGKTIPAGINGVLKIDGKSNPRIARGIMMKPPSIHSNSVTVKFGWEPSHQFDAEHEFFDKVGTFAKDGELIRLVVTTISAYHETSLVSHGADVFAQQIGADGKIVNPDYANANYSFSADKPVSGSFSLDYKDPESILYLDHSIPFQYNNNNNNSNPQLELKMKEILEKLITELGFDAGALTEENVVAQIKAKVDSLASDNATLTSDKEALTTEKSDNAALLETEKASVTRLEGELETANSNNALLDTFSTETKTEAVRLYKLSKGEDADQTIVDLINKSEPKVAQSFKEQYEKEVDEKFGAQCNDCQSTNVDRFSAKPPMAGGEGSKGNAKAGEAKATNTEMRETFKSRRRNSSRLFNKDNK